MKYLILIATTLLISTSCNQGKEELARSNEQKDSILKISNEREESINQFITSFNEIERNLDSVAIRQQVITAHSQKGGGELKLDQKDRINAEIEAINSLMQLNSDKIIELKRRLKKAANKTAAFLKEMSFLIIPTF